MKSTFWASEAEEIIHSGLSGENHGRKLGDVHLLLAKILSGDPLDFNERPENDFGAMLCGKVEIRRFFRSRLGLGY